MSSLRKDLDRILRQIQRPEYGCTVEMSSGKTGHWRISRPGYQTISTSSTPSDYFALKKIQRDIRVYLGIDLRGQL